MASRKICVGFIHGENNQAPKGEKGETPKGRGEVKLLAGLRYSSEVGINERLTEMDPLSSPCRSASQPSRYKDCSLSQFWIPKSRASYSEGSLFIHRDHNQVLQDGWFI